MNGDRPYLFNGINGETGEYLLDPQSAATLAAMVRGEERDEEGEALLAGRTRTFGTAFSTLPFGVDKADRTQAGWALVFHEDESREVRDALKPLLEHRQRQIGDHERCKVLVFQENETKREWLARHGVAAGTFEPTKVPYYLLLVGSPSRFPFQFTHLLDIEYGVGRLHFDEPSGYRKYADGVMAYETGTVPPNSKEAVFFAPRHAFDRATQLSADLLVNPLADGTPGHGTVVPTDSTAGKNGFRVRKLWGEAATKAALSSVFTRSEDRRPPAFLFTASHGVGFPIGHPGQADRQGSLVCQDWPGLGQIGPEHYFSGSDLPADARVQGLMSFHFACYGAGTPSHDRFFHAPGAAPPQIAAAPFLASLPKALLSNGALACIGHVERAYAYSFITPKAGPQLQPFRYLIWSLLFGMPVGYAVQYMNARFAVLSTELAAKLESVSAGNPTSISDEELADAWIERNDAEGYLVVGDPAVRLRVDALPSPADETLTAASVSFPMSPSVDMVRTIEPVPGAEFPYYLVCFDKHGRERADDPDAPRGHLSEMVVSELESHGCTDVFLMSHGWKGDVPAAKRQYEAWSRAMLTCRADRQRARDLRPSFRPLVVGLHWPSLPWGDEDLSSPGMAFGPREADPIEALVESYADCLAETDSDTRKAQAAIRTIVAAAAENIQPVSLPKPLVRAYVLLNELTELATDGPAAAPGSDREDFDPERAYQAAIADDAISYGSDTLGGLLAPLRQLSFWKMKDRARKFGESGGTEFLQRLQAAAGDRDVRFHLMGHSFGCIVASSIVAGGPSGSPQPVHSLFLVQGALSLWSYCKDIPVELGRAGYFHSVVKDGRVTGPVVTTSSEFDTAVGRFYPLGAGGRHQVVFAPGDFPKYGALGAFGARGPGFPVVDLAMLTLDDDYAFSGGRVHNLESSQFIREGSGFSGAHNDIAKPQVAHAFWGAVLTQ